jgi:hypothetical protein
MVFMAVGNQNPAQVSAPLSDVGDVRDDEVDSPLLLFRELRPAIEQQQITFELDRRHILADLADTAERDYPQATARAGYTGSRLRVSLLSRGLLISPAVPVLAIARIAVLTSTLRLSIWLPSRRLLFVATRAAA